MLLPWEFHPCPPGWVDMARPDVFKKLNQTVSSFSAEMVASRQFAANGDEIHTAMRKELLNRICNTGGKVIPANRASPPRGTPT